MEKILTIFMFALLSVSFCAQAKQKTLELTTELEAESTLNIHVAVGELEISRYSGDQVKVTVAVKPQNDWHWGSDDYDINNATLEVDRHSDQLHLEIPIDGTEQDWRVMVPHAIHLRLDVGVGEVDVQDADRDVRVDVGVGEVDISLAHDDYRSISADSGVGSADIKGLQNIEHERTMVSESSQVDGAGQYRVNVDVGVGDIDIRR
ncbi:DUF4097 family beta strand repeat-containing protein [Aestuariibacter salexigens]|uniref:DUF4097 family beta strand repeat-containing protein n=1 Tax=Aestuariibacter salexigens TaxID=226010 RepID=UPI00040C2934|nr:DUF4097 family beta strand repeat-containing protein [Aestuariibacter salexigens]